MKLSAKKRKINVKYKYSSTGGLAGIDAASPDMVEAIPEKQADGTYKVEWTLPTCGRISYCARSQRAEPICG